MRSLIHRRHQTRAITKQCQMFIVHCSPPILGCKASTEHVVCAAVCEAIQFGTCAFAQQREVRRIECEASTNLVRQWCQCICTGWGRDDLVTHFCHTQTSMRFFGRRCLRTQLSILSSILAVSWEVARLCLGRGLGEPVALHGCSCSSLPRADPAGNRDICTGTVQSKPCRDSI